MISPAKINLGLEVHHRRPEDGYHYISSIFIPISFGDFLEIESARKSTLETVNLLVGDRFESFEAVSERGNLEKNILWKAIQAVRPMIPGHEFHIRLTKKIPTGAGLGGGSSNAGIFLHYVMEKFDLEYTKIFKLAVSLGADVPFFLLNRPALVTGIGDRMVPVEIGPGIGVLCLPNIHIDTRNAYIDLKRTLQATPPLESLSELSGDVREALQQSDWGRVRVLSNHFEEVVFPVHPVLSRLKDTLLQHGASYASMSGSGSSIYALVDRPELQTELIHVISHEFPWIPCQPFQFPL